jgi:hypothetical protein
MGIATPSFTGTREREKEGHAPSPATNTLAIGTGGGSCKADALRLARLCLWRGPGLFCRESLAEVLPQWFERFFYP